MQLLNSACNMGPLSNAITLWLGIQPADVFLYVFLPPLLLDSAVRTDFFTFKKAGPRFASGACLCQRSSLPCLRRVASPRQLSSVPCGAKVTSPWVVCDEWTPRRSGAAAAAA